MARTLAMDCSFLAKYGELPSVFGFDIAVSGFMDALLRYSTYDRFVFFHQPGTAAPIMPSTDRNVEVRTESTVGIPSVIGRGDILTWFQPDTATEPVKYRNAFARRLFPYSTVIHDSFAPESLRAHYLWLLLDGFAACDSFICTSRAVRKVVSETLAYISDEMNHCAGTRVHYGGRLDVLPLGVDTERFRCRSKAAMRHELGWPEDAFILLWFGRISAVDKADLLPVLRVFRRLVEANPTKRLRFVIAGNDHKYIPFAPALIAFAASIGIAEHVLILDGTSTAERHKFFAAADVFTSPCDNLQETFGITPIEAMATGTPQLVSDWNGYRDSVEHGVTGFRIPTHWAGCDGDAAIDFGIGGRGYQGFVLAQSVAVDLREYQAALQRMIENPALLASMADASRKRAEQMFSWPVVIRRYEELWAELGIIARTLHSSDLPQAPFARTQVYRRFASFPTAILGSGTHVNISNDGRRLLAGTDPFPWHSPQEAAFVNPEEMIEVIRSVETHAGTFDDIVNRLGAEGANRRSEILRTLMWGIKHGFLDVRIPQTPASSSD